MKKNSIIFGLIAGIVVSIPMLIITSNCTFDFEKGMLIGYSSMLIAFSLVFVGIKNYRDKFNQGTINFGKAFKIGSIIVLIASTIYVVSWLINYFYFIPDFAEKYSEHMINNLKQEGASAIEIEAKTKEMIEFSKMYKNPLINALITYTEILPVGLLVTLVSAIILKRKNNS
ncbi:conserved membrane hypothetical protein [Flavobacterium sp. 9AF]|uniref:DUF4199 domain-containing protein n=1 Tax=Flavobacterium sp. 9AF TaxID=2653142 RepID=UPI0012F303B8|nr:DUF4199 domain-containing protein [Flavobacterium sp. 9AF]VXC18173.1 conserved membrane hypothetical protein [Flavobacterium sp. 9AF]